MDEPLLEQVAYHLQLHGKTLQDIALQLIVDEVTRFPIFIFSQPPVAIGESIPGLPDATAGWYIKVITTEQLIEKGVIPLEKAKHFVASFKAPQDYICLLLIPHAPQTPQFIFAPYAGYTTSE